MDPRDLLARFEDITVEFWDPSLVTATNDGFVASGKFCRLMTKDRFLSQFNLPPRRRMMHHSPDMVFPASRVIRLPSLGEVFIVGDHPGIDLVTDKAYAALTTLHTVTNDPLSSGVLAEITRAIPSGSPNDYRVKPSILYEGMYCDFANAAVVHDADVVDEYSNSYVVYLPSSVTLQRYDLIRGNGKTLRVQAVYADSGFHVAKCIEADEDRFSFVYIKANAKRVMNSQTRRLEGGSESYLMTGQFAKNHDFAAWSPESQDYKDIVIDCDTLPKDFIPSSQDRVVLNKGTFTIEDGEGMGYGEGVSYEVKVVDLDRTNKQYRLRVV